MSAINMPAQEIPILPEDPAVLKGVMPNGMAYYLVTNRTDKGVADFALVQKTGLLTASEQDAGKALSAAEGALDSLERFRKPSVREFLTKHDIFPGRNGFVDVTDDATVFRFNDVRLDVGVNVADSTLLMMMDIADRANYAGDGFISKWYSPADQAIVISGDIDTKSVASKLLYMSYMIPEKESTPRQEYVRKGQPHTTVHAERNGFAEIHATWTSRRVPREYMNTIQPEIFEMSLNTLGDAAVNRIRKLLKDSNIPVANVSYSHICSSTYPYDDSFTIHVAVEKKDAAKAEEAVCSVMSSIDREGLMTNEYVISESSYIQSLAREAEQSFISNHEYVERCVNAFLYNSSLASPKERLSFHTSRNLPDTMRRRLFNGIASALIDSVDVSESPSRWEYGDLMMPDTLTRPVPPVKIKLKSTKREPVSGGVIWTFSNGFKVVFKNIPSDRIHYSFALNGGYGGIDRLASGEGAFMADYLGSCRVCGVGGGDFRRILRKEGITMNFAVNLSNMMVNGSLPKGKVSLLLRSLLALTNERTEDSDAFDYSRRSEYMALDYAKGSYYSRMTAIDSIMCPDYRYSLYKTKGKVSADFQSRAEAYFSGQFAKTNDGVLILAGNMNEDSLKKLLLEYVGNFRTADAVSRKPVVRYQPVSGWATYTVDGNSDNVDVAISARMPLTMDNFIAANLASMMMKRELARKFNEYGMYFTLQLSFQMYPEERLNAMISVPSASLANLSDLRDALTVLKSMEMTDGDLKPYKEALKHHLSQQMTNPSYWINAVALRYLDGKDLSTNYAAKVDAMTACRVKSVLSLLDNGCKVEYVTMDKME